MLNPTPLGGKFLYPISDRELERRWSLVRAAMKREDVTLLVIQNEGQDLGGYVRWFSDVAAGYPETVLFPADSDMILINSGAPSHPLPPPFMARGVAERISAPYFRTVNFTNGYDAALCADRIKKLGLERTRIGLVNLGRIAAGFYKTLLEELPQAEFLDFTDRVDEIKAVKSPEEIERIRASARMHDAIMAAVPTMIRPGRLELDIYNDVHHLANQMGAEGQFLVMVGSNPMGRPVGQATMLYLGRRIEPGDQVFVMLESTGPGGFFNELGRVFCLSEPTQELLECYEQAKQAQALCADLLCPGGSPAGVLEALNAFLRAHGYEKEERLFAHGQGYDLIERPACMPGENLRFQENMCIVLHPCLTNAHAQVWLGDNYLIHADGAERLHKCPQELVVL